MYLPIYLFITYNRNRVGVILVTYSRRYPLCNCNSNLQTSKAPVESQAQGTSLFTSDVTNQKGCQ